MDAATIAGLGVAALLVRVGMVCYACGLARSKNAAGAVLRHVFDMCLAILAFIAVGSAIAHASGNGIIAFGPSVLFGSGRISDSLLIFNLTVVLLATGIVPGAVAERSRFWPMGLTSLVLAVLVVPLAAQWAWSGWLAQRGLVDVAGASVIHLSGGMCAAAAAVLVGPRLGKYNRDGSSNFIPGHNVPLASIGVLVMLAGWLLYVASAALVHRNLVDAGTLGDVVSQIIVARAMLNVLIAAAAGGLAALAFTHFRYGKPDLFLVYSGLLGAAVAMTGSAGRVNLLYAAAIGLVAGLLVPWTVVKLDLGWRIDDPTAAVAIHGVGGALGVLLAAGGHPTTVGLLYQLGVQALGVAAIGVLALLVSGGVLLVARSLIGLRSSEADETDGLDLAEHDVNAYPDFQQTMIKSYHLREA